MNQHPFGEYFTGVGGDPSGIGALGVTVQHIGADTAVATENPVVKTFKAVYPLLSIASAGACAYHGYRRNQSVGWAIGWALLGGAFPVITPAIAVGQGFGKRK